MKFKLENRLGAELEKVEEVMFSERYYEYLKRYHSAVDNIEVIEQRFEEDKIYRTVRYTPKPIIERVGPKKVPKEALAFTEHSTYDRRNHVLEFENRPVMDIVRKFLSNYGTIRFLRDGRATLRILEGELRVKFPVLGPLAERIIYSQARKLLEEEILCFNQYIAAGVR